MRRWVSSRRKGWGIELTYTDIGNYGQDLIGHLLCAFMVLVTSPLRRTTMTTENAKSRVRLVGPKGQFPQASLVPPPSSGYVLLALEVDRRPWFGYRLESRLKKDTIERLNNTANDLKRRSDVVDVNVFKTSLIPFGRGSFLDDRPGVQIARYDVVMIVEMLTKESSESLINDADFLKLSEVLQKTSRLSKVITAESQRSLGPVDHGRDGVFLLNWFYADDLQQNLDIWEYTAGWFQQETGLDNSVVMVPNEYGTDHTIINHCRWDKLIDFIPSFVFKKSFKTFVLDNFKANNTAAIPILYRLA